MEDLSSATFDPSLASASTGFDSLSEEFYEPVPNGQDSGPVFDGPSILISPPLLHDMHTTFEHVDVSITRLKPVVGFKLIMFVVLSKRLGDRSCMLPSSSTECCRRCEYLADHT